ncbi:hypothetical protein HMPREF1988_01739 [Porphyromonas gingivalis F0185]|nr:hypothetical protein HMPREF1988_01739 [Porphyromonas gingivalis F0185]
MVLLYKCKKKDGVSSCANYCVACDIKLSHVLSLYSATVLMLVLYASLRT